MSEKEKLAKTLEETLDAKVESVAGEPVAHTFSIYVKDFARVWHGIESCVTGMSGLEFCEINKTRGIQIRNVFSPSCSWYVRRYEAIPKKVKKPATRTADNPGEAAIVDDTPKE